MMQTNKISMSPPMNSPVSTAEKRPEKEKKAVRYKKGF